MTQKDLHSILLTIIGKKILQVNAGGSTGSIFSLDIGDQLLRNEVQGQIFYKGEFILMIYSSWRLIDTKLNKPITGWRENSEVNGPMCLGLDKILEDTVENVSISTVFDLVIEFSSGRVLNVFCDLTPNCEWDTNWFFKAGAKIYSVNNSLEAVQEK